MSASYDVVVNYSSTGDIGGSLEKGMAKAKASTQDWMNGLSGFASSFNSAFDNIASNVVGKIQDIAKVAATAMAAGIAKGVHEGFKYNQENENALVSIGSIFNMTGETKGFNEGINLASRQVAQMRKDARELPGTFSDLQGIMSRIAVTSSENGLDANGLETLAKRTMVGGAMLGMTSHGQMETVGREMAAILEGRATSRMPLFAKMATDLGDAKTFNKLGATERLSKVQKGLDKLNTPEGMEAVKNMWSTVTSNLGDSVKQGLGDTTNPLFDKVKSKIRSVMERPADGLAAGSTSDQRAFDQRAKQIDELKTKVSDGLVKAFDKGLEAIEKWGPPVLTFLGTMERGVERVINKLTGMMGGGGGIMGFLNDPGAFDKIEHVIGKMLALRAGTGILAGAGGMMMPMMQMMNFMGSPFKGLGAYIGQGGAVGMGTGVVGGEGGAALAIGELTAVAVPAAVAIGLIAFASAGAVSAYMDSTSMFHNATVSLVNDIATNAAKTGSAFEKLWDSVEPLAQSLGVVLLAAIDSTVIVINGTVTALAALIGGAGKAASWFLGLSGILPGKGDKEALAKLDTSYNADMADSLQSIRDARGKDQYAMDGTGGAGATIGTLTIKEMNVQNNDKAEGDKLKSKTHITMHVQIKVEGNEDPDRVADTVRKKLLQTALNPKTSPDDIRTNPYNGRSR